MKQIALFLITFYQNYISTSLMHLTGTRYICRYSPTCSEYAKSVIREKGVIIGGYLSIKRILSCQPYTALHGKSI